MRSGLWAVAAVLALSSTAMSANEPKPDQWQKMYHDASIQLRAAQDRRAELSAQNTRLVVHAAELQKRLELAEEELTGLRREMDALVAQDIPFPAADPPAWVDTQWPLSSVDSSWVDQ
jgi:septal ring factor EnvC (AmiA/AmiB activator)